MFLYGSQLRIRMGAPFLVFRISHWKRGAH